MATLAVVAIRLYQAGPSRQMGRNCLFHPSCSHRAVAVLQQRGFYHGVRAADAQLRRCGGEFTLIRNVQGQPTLVTADGQRFEASALSPRLRL